MTAPVTAAGPSPRGGDSRLKGQPRNVPPHYRGGDPAPWDSPSRASPDRHVSDRKALLSREAEAGSPVGTSVSGHTAANSFWTGDKPTEGLGSGFVYSSSTSSHRSCHQSLRSKGAIPRPVSGLLEEVGPPGTPSALALKTRRECRLVGRQTNRAPACWTPRDSPVPPVLAQGSLCCRRRPKERHGRVQGRWSETRASRVGFGRHPGQPPLQGQQACTPAHGRLRGPDGRAGCPIAQPFPGTTRVAPACGLLRRCTRAESCDTRPPADLGHL